MRTKKPIRRNEEPQQIYDSINGIFQGFRVSLYLSLSFSVCLSLSIYHSLSLSILDSILRIARIYISSSTMCSILCKYTRLCHFPWQPDRSKYICMKFMYYMHVCVPSMFPHLAHKTALKRSPQITNQKFHRSLSLITRNRL